MSTRSRVRAIVWILVAIAIPSALFVASLSSDFYNLTSPPEFGLHVVLRKIYSIGAFALVSNLIARALGECGMTLTPKIVITLGAAYSGAIEVTQYNVGSQEGVWWNLIDIGCGALGGAIATRMPGGSKRPKASVNPDNRIKRRRGFVKKRITQFRDDAPNETSRKSKIVAPRR